MDRKAQLEAVSAMKRFATSLSIFGLVLGYFVSTAHAEDCFPACRAGYVCNLHGQCVSECNPPCGTEESCRAGKCVVEDEGAPPSSSSSTDPKTIELLMMAGLGMHVTNETAPALAMNFSVAFGGRHAFVAGAQGGVGLFEGGTTGEFGLNLGYRGIFTRGELGAGLLILAQPQVWTGFSDPAFSLGGAIGPVLTYKRLIVSIPFSLSYVFIPGIGHSATSAVVFSPTLFAGVSF